MTRPNLLNYTLTDLEYLVADIGESKYRAKQIYKWLHQSLVRDINDMTNLSVKLRQHLSESFEISLPSIVQETPSTDGTLRWVLKFNCGNSIETVFIPESSRGTLCVSSQAGCAANCHFCQTAVGGFNRDLSVGEIIGQLNFAIHRLIELGIEKKITNVVMMGMGEPLLNYDNVLKATDMMMDDDAYGLSKYRVTISTIGIIPSLLELSKHSQASLTVSLHGTTDEIRTQIMPINRKYPLQALLQVCKNYFPKESKRKITFAYIMLDQVNDSREDAIRLANLVSNIPCKINLIPFNTFPEARFQCSSKEQIMQFKDILLAKGLQTTVRKTRGDDVAAACGQLVGQVLKRERKSKSSFNK